MADQLTAAEVAAQDSAEVAAARLALGEAQAAAAAARQREEEAYDAVERVRRIARAQRAEAVTAALIAEMAAAGLRAGRADPSGSELPAVRTDHGLVVSLGYPEDRWTGGRAYRATWERAPLSYAAGSGRTLAEALVALDDDIRRRRWRGKAATAIHATLTAAIARLEPSRAHT